MSHRILFSIFTLQVLTLLQPPTTVAQPVRLLPGEVLSIISGSSMSAKVAKDSAGGFSYDYRVSNAVTSNAEIENIDIDITTASDNVEIPGSDLFIEGARLRHIPDMITSLAMRGIQIVPVGARVPAGWIGSLDTAGRIGWFPRHSSGIPPGQALGGFVVLSRGLPGIRAGYLDPEFQQASVEEATQEDEDRMDAIGDAILLRLKTVGPTAPPKVFDPLQYTDYILDLKNQSISLGWVRDQGAASALEEKLQSIRQQVASIRDNKIALTRGQKILSLGAQFLQFVESNSCKDFECAESRPLTAESYALLFFNMDYFLTQVRQACGLATPPPALTPRRGEMPREDRSPERPAPKRKK